MKITGNNKEGNMKSKIGTKSGSWLTTSKGYDDQQKISIDIEFIKSLFAPKLKSTDLLKLVETYTT